MNNQDTSTFISIWSIFTSSSFENWWVSIKIISYVIFVILLIQRKQTVGAVTHTPFFIAFHVQYLHSPCNTLYLKLQCPAVQPPLVVISHNGHNIIDFHQVAVGEWFASHTVNAYISFLCLFIVLYLCLLFSGEKVIKRCTVQNISKESLDVSLLQQILISLSVKTQRFTHETKCRTIELRVMF